MHAARLPMRPNKEGEPMDIHEHQAKDLLKRFGMPVPDGGIAEHDYAVYRSTQSTGATYFNDADGNGRIEQISQTRLCSPAQATVYTNGDVTMCAASPASS